MNKHVQSSHKHTKYYSKSKAYKKPKYKLNNPIYNR
jgi:hypothetical protein